MTDLTAGAPMVPDQAAAQPEPDIPYEKIYRENMRWQCLVYMDAERPKRVAIHHLLQCVQHEYPAVSRIEVCRAIDYLELHALLTITIKSGKQWLRLTGTGIDVVEYNINAPAGVRRPDAPRL